MAIIFDINSKSVIPEQSTHPPVATEAGTFCISQDHLLGLHRAHVAEQGNTVSVPVLADKWLCFNRRPSCWKEALRLNKVGV